MMLEGSFPQFPTIDDWNAYVTFAQPCEKQAKRAGGQNTGENINLDDAGEIDVDEEDEEEAKLRGEQLNLALHTSAKLGMEKVTLKWV